MGRLLILLLAIGPVDDLLSSAEDHFRAGRHAEAARDLAAAYELDPKADVLLNWANAERLADNCPRAIELYDQYLEETAGSEDELSAQYAQIAAEKRDECKANLPPPPAEPDPEPEPDRLEPAEPATNGSEPREPASEVPEPPPVELEDTPPPVHWYRDPAGWALAGTGIACLATAGGLLGGGFSRESKARDQPSHAAYLDEIKTSGQLEIAGWVMLGVGAAATVGGIIRFAVVSRRNRSNRRAALPTPGALRIRF